jgi:hypothetical protein
MERAPKVDEVDVRSTPASRALTCARREVVSYT